MTPLIKKKFGKNLIALATQGSYGRNEDLGYSDLELIVFVKKVKPKAPLGGMGKIREGLLVELLWTTKETYLKEVKEPSGHWYLAGSDYLFPIINPKFIEQLNRYKVKNLKKKCLKQAAAHWHEVQEATSKTLNAISANNKQGLPLLAFDMLRHMLIALSFINQQPYVTFSRFVSQAKRLKLRPKSLAKLTEQLNAGDFQDRKALKKLSVEVFEEFEVIFKKLGCELYDNNLDPNIPNGLY